MEKSQLQASLNQSKEENDRANASRSEMLSKNELVMKEQTRMNADRQAKENELNSKITAQIDEMKTMSLSINNLTSERDNLQAKLNDNQNLLMHNRNEAF